MHGVLISLLVMIGSDGPMGTPVLGRGGGSFLSLMYTASHFLDNLPCFLLFFSQAFASFPQLNQLVETKVFIFGKLLPNFATG
jgi:hypothetical protein